MSNRLLARQSALRLSNEQPSLIHPVSYSCAPLRENLTFGGALCADLLSGCFACVSVWFGCVCVAWLCVCVLECEHIIELAPPVTYPCGRRLLLFLG